MKILIPKNNEISFRYFYHLMGNINYICYDCGYLLRFYEGEELEKVEKAANKK